MVKDEVQTIYTNYHINPKSAVTTPSTIYPSWHVSTQRESRNKTCWLSFKISRHPIGKHCLSPTQTPQGQSTSPSFKSKIKFKDKIIPHASECRTELQDGCWGEKSVKWEGFITNEAEGYVRDGVREILPPLLHCSNVSWEVARGNDNDIFWLNYRWVKMCHYRKNGVITPETHAKQNHTSC